MSPVEEVTACLSNVELMVGEGHTAQSPLENKSMKNATLPPLNFNTDSSKHYDAALKCHGAGPWAEQLSKVTDHTSYEVGWEQRRYGMTTVEFVRAVFPEYDQLTCPKRQPDTFVLPVFFAKFGKDAVYQRDGNREIERCRTGFMYACLILAYEMVLHFGRGETGYILVMAPLLSFLNAFEYYVKNHIHGIIEQLLYKFRISAERLSSDRSLFFLSSIAPCLSFSI